MSELSDAIKQNAQGPKRVENDATSAEQHSLKEQIAADKHLASQAAASHRFRGLRFNKISPPGAP